MKRAVLIISLIIALIIGSFSRLSLLGWLFFVGYGTVFIFGIIHIITNLHFIRNATNLKNSDLLLIFILHLLYLCLFFFQSDFDDSRGYIVVENIFGKLAWPETEKTSWILFLICLVLYLILTAMLLLRIRKIDSNFSMKKVRITLFSIAGLLILPVAVLYGFGHLRYISEAKKDERIGKYESLKRALRNKSNVKHLRLYEYPDSYTEIPRKVFTLIELEELEMYSNEIKEIPKDISALKNIKVLDLQYNQIKTIPDEIADLPKLENLILSNNLIDSINPKICNCSGLKRLSIGGPSLNSIPHCFNKMPNLETLIIQSDSINNFMDEFKKFTNLKELVLYTYANEIRDNKKYSELKAVLTRTKISIP
jgi:hypothetical protein